MGAGALSQAGPGGDGHQALVDRLKSRLDTMINTDMNHMSDAGTGAGMGWHMTGTGALEPGERLAFLGELVAAVPPPHPEIAGAAAS